MERWKHIDMPRRMETDGPLGRSDGGVRQTFGGQGEVQRGRNVVRHWSVVWLARACFRHPPWFSRSFRPDASFKDKVLVTRQTDPGWTIVFPFVKGPRRRAGAESCPMRPIVARELGDSLHRGRQ